MACREENNPAHILIQNGGLVAPEEEKRVKETGALLMQELNIAAHECADARNARQLHKTAAQDSAREKVRGPVPAQIKEGQTRGESHPQNAKPTETARKRQDADGEAEEKRGVITGESAPINE